MLLWRASPSARLLSELVVELWPRMSGNRVGSLALLLGYGLGRLLRMRSGFFVSKEACVRHEILRDFRAAHDNRRCTFRQRAHWMETDSRRAIA